MPSNSVSTRSSLAFTSAFTSGSESSCSTAFASLRYCDPIGQALAVVGPGLLDQPVVGEQGRLSAPSASWSAGCAVAASAIRRAAVGHRVDEVLALLGRLETADQEGVGGVGVRADQVGVDRLDPDQLGGVRLGALSARRRTAGSPARRPGRRRRSSPRPGSGTRASGPACRRTRRAIGLRGLGAGVAWLLRGRWAPTAGAGGDQVAGGGALGSGSRLFSILLLRCVRLRSRPRIFGRIRRVDRLVGEVLGEDLTQLVLGGCRHVAQSPGVPADRGLQHVPGEPAVAERAVPRRRGEDLPELRPAPPGSARSRRPRPAR